MTRLPLSEATKGSERRTAAVAAAKALMRLMPAREPRADDYGLNEIFRHEDYLTGDNIKKAAIRRSSSLFRYEEEDRKPFFRTYFENYRTSVAGDSTGDGFRRHLAGKEVLDFGCFTGGRGVRWAKEYGIARILGTDINPIYIKAATEFAESCGVEHDYRVLNEDGSMPFGNNSVDTIVTFDVFEHVNDLSASLRECLRVLRPGGVMFIVFPSFYNPLESHLDLATHTPALQWIFSGETLTRAYNEILGENAGKWYLPINKGSTWEVLPTLNGTTGRSFYRILKTMPIRILHKTRRPILTTGKSFPVVRKLLVRPALSAALALRIFDEVLIDRVAVVAEKAN